MAYQAEDHHLLADMSANVRLNVQMLEVCWSCQRVSECKHWLVNDSVPVWLCGRCVEEVSYRMADETGMPLSLSACDVKD